MPLSKPIRGTGLNRPHLFARGLKGCYLFNEATGLKVYDSSGHSSHGDMDECDPSWDGGKFGSCIKFGGSDGIRLGTGQSYGSGASFTVVAWVRTSASTQQSIFMQRNGGYKGAIWFQIDTNGYLYLMIFDVDSKDLQSTGDVVVNDGFWHQVACTYDSAGGQGRLFVDGIASGSFGTYAGLNLDPCISCSIGFDDRLHSPKTDLLSGQFH